MPLQRGQSACDNNHFSYCNQGSAVGTQCMCDTRSKSKFVPTTEGTPQVALQVGTFGITTSPSPDSDWSIGKPPISLGGRNLRETHVFVLCLWQGEAASNTIQDNKGRDHQGLVQRDNDSWREGVHGSFHCDHSWSIVGNQRERVT